MKKAHRIIRYILLIFFSLLIVLVVVAAFTENKIAKIAIDQVSKTTDIPIQIDDIDFSLVRNFPYATIRCNHLLVSSPNDSILGSTDTLAYAGRLFVSVDIKPLLKSVFKVRKVVVADAELFYKVDTAGVSNFDFLIDTTSQDVIDTSANSVFLDLKHMKLENVKCIYSDKKQKASADLFIEQLDLSGMIDANQYKGGVEGKVILSNCTYDTTQIYLMNQATANFKANYESGVLSIEKAAIAVDEDVLLSLNGTIRMGDSLSVDVVAGAEKIDLKGIGKYVPESYLKEYGVRNFTGTLAAEAKVEGFVSDSIMPFVDARFDLSDGSLLYQDYPQLHNISLSGKATNGEQKNSATTRADLSSFHFQIGNSTCDLSGQIENLDKLTYDFKSDVNLDLNDVAGFIPDSLLQSANGKMNASVFTKGILPDSITETYIQSVLVNTQINVNFTNVSARVDSSISVRNVNGALKYKPGQISATGLKAGVHYKTYNIDSLQLDALIAGKYTTLDSLNLQLKQLDAGLGKSKIELTGTLKNLLAPNYTVSGNLNIDLAEIKNLMPDSLVNNLSGNVSGTFQSAARLNLDSISEQINSVLFEHSRFSVNCNHVNVTTPDSLTSVENLTGELTYSTDTIQIPQLEVTYLGINLGMSSVSATGIYSAAILNQPKELVLHGNFGVDYMDYALIESFMQEDSTAVSQPGNESNTEPMRFSYKINGNMTANSLKYEEAIFSDVDSKFLVKENYYVLDSLRMNAFNGTSLSSIKIEMKPNDEMDMFFRTDISKMDVSQLVKNFGKYMDYADIQAENVEGSISTKMEGEIVLNNFEPVYESLMLNGDMTIENGALINVKPVMEIQKIPGVGLKNLDKLYFSTLSSSVFLYKNKLFIPRTEIRSSSFDAMFLGMYSFNEDYEYHIRMFLGEVLSSKSKANLKKHAQDGGFDDEEDEKDITQGRTSIYVVSKSLDGKEKAGFDNKRDRQNMSAKVNLQKQMVDLRFHPALVNYNTEE